MQEKDDHQETHKQKEHRRKLTGRTIHKSISSTPTPCGQNVSLGDDCNYAKCGYPNSACVNKNGANRCSCAPGYVANFLTNMCIPGPTRLTTSELLFRTNVSTVPITVGSIDLDVLRANYPQTVFNTSIKVILQDADSLDFVPVDNTPTSFSVVLKKPLPPRGRSYVAEITATNPDTGFDFKQTVSVAVGSLLPIQVCLVDGSKAGTLITDLGSYASTGGVFALSSTDATVNALFQVTDDGLVETGQDVFLEIYEDDATIAKEYTFSILYNTRDIATIRVFIFKQAFTRTLSESLAEVLMRYSLPSPRYSVSFRSKPEIINLVDNNGLIILSNGLDFETSGKTLSFVIDILSDNVWGTISIPIDINVQDENDVVPRFSSSSYDFTILAGSLPYSLIAVVDVLDEDTVGTISYSLSGTFADDFSIDDKGVIRSKTTLSTATFGNEFSLNVTANDGERSSKAVPVLIRLVNIPASIIQLNANQNGSIVEGANSGTYIASMAVSGHTGYEFADRSATTWFNLSRSTATVTTLEPLDRENPPTNLKPTYTVIARAEGQCDPVVIGQLGIRIVDINDNSPELHPSYTGSVKENSPEGTLVDGLIGIQVLDKDEGKNAEMVFTLEGAGSQYFQVEGLTNEFTIKTSNQIIDRETIQTFSFILKAIDRADIPAERKTSTTSIVISVLDVNDNAPSWTSTTSPVSVQENSGIRTVTSVSASDADIGHNANVSYLMSTGDKGYFVIDEVSGEIRTTGSIDREIHPNFQLTIEARDHGSPPDTSSTNIVVNIIDVNDNEPSFTERQYRGSVTEGSPCSTSILTVSASDDDFGKNADVTYSVQDAAFTVNPTTGDIFCTSPLDYESGTLHIFDVLAIDDGTTKLTSTSTVIVTVVDANDSPPELTLPEVVDITEWYTDKPVLIVRAEDKDSGLNSDVSFSMTSNEFSITKYENVGVVRVKPGVLKPTAATTYPLSITATDGGSPSLSSTRTVQINVIGVPNTIVMFNNPEMTFTMEENRDYSIIPIGKVVVDKSATVAVKYSLPDNGTYFRITEDKGEITCTAEIDREKTPVIVLMVRAAAVPQHLGVDIAVVTITVGDKNDNSPAFPYQSAQYVFQVPEDAPHLHPVAPVTANDQDEGVNARIFYTMTSQSPAVAPFSIDLSSGQISVNLLNVTLDREREQVYKLIVTATDQGLPSLTSSTTIEIAILDINDVTPTFSSPVYTMTVSENEPTYTEVTQVTPPAPPFVSASDTDASFNGTVSYITDTLSLTGGGNCPFIVESGKVKVSGSINYESTKEFRCLIRAYDAEDCSNCPHNTGTATIIVNVLDVNDNSPVFQGGPFVTNISRDSLIGDSVIILTAIDADGAQYGYDTVTYFILSDNPYFSIGRNSGKITVSASLMATENDFFKLYVRATDNPQGSEPIATFTNVTVHIYDTAPRPFFTTTYTMVLQEEQTPSADDKITIEAFIRDAGRIVPCNCDYSLVSSSETYFELHPSTGTLTLIKSLNREETGSVHQVAVRAVDKVLGLGRTTQVQIQVEDINDNKPFFTNKTQHFIVLQTAEVGSVIGHLTSMDRDTYDWAVYILAEDNDKVSLIRENGTLLVRSTLVNETELKFIASVQDAGNLKPSPDAILTVQSTTEVTVEVRPVDYNENAPVFTQESYVAGVQALSPQEEVIKVNLKANDPDGDIVTYRILTGNTREIVKIDSTTGKLSLRYDLEDSVGNRIELVVIAEDDGHPQKTGTCSVTLNVVNNVTTACIAESELDFLKINKTERDIFLGLFAALAILLVLVGILAICAIYKWRRAARILGVYQSSGYPDKGTELKPYTGLNQAFQEDYDKLRNKDFSAEEGVDNPWYVGSGGSRRAVLPPRQEPTPDY